MGRSTNSYSKRALKRLSLHQKQYELLLFCFPLKQDGVVGNGHDLLGKLTLKQI